MKKQILTLFICAVLGVNAFALECPPCISDALKPPSHKKTSDGKPIYTIKIDPSWNIPGTKTTEPKIWNALTEAVRRWNAADPAEVIEIDQNTSKVSVLVRRGTLPANVNGHSQVNVERSLFGFNISSSSTTKMTLPPESLTRLDDNLTGIAGHEIGHTIKGLSDAWLPLNDVDIPGTCKDTVMAQSGPNATRSPEQNRPQAIDKSSADKFRTDKANCSVTHKALLLDQSQGGGGDSVTVLDSESTIAVGGCFVSESTFWTYRKVAGDEPGEVKWVKDKQWTSTYTLCLEN